MPGTLTLRPLTANLTRDTEFFGTMDPYCKVILGNQKITGQVCRNGGKHPTWEDTLILRRVDEPTCQIEVKEKDWLLPDTIIGTCQVSLRDLETDKRVLKWYPVSFESKPVGKILLEINYEPDHTSIQQVQTGKSLPERIIQNAPESKPEEPKRGFLQGLIYGWTPFGSKEAPSEPKQQAEAPVQEAQNVVPPGQHLHHDHDQKTYLQQSQVYQGQNWAPPSGHMQQENNYPQKYPQFNPQEYPNAGANYQGSYNGGFNHPQQYGAGEVIDYRDKQGNEVQNAGEYLSNYYTNNDPYKGEEKQYIEKSDPLNVIRGL